MNLLDAFRILNAEPEDFSSEHNSGFDKVFGDKYEDVAGLKPLPTGRMFRQAGKPMYRGTRKPGDVQETLSRNQNVRNTIDNWDPIEAENKQRLNNTNPSKRSKLAIPSTRTSIETLSDLERKAEDRFRRASDRTYSAEHYEGGPETYRKKAEARSKFERDADVSEFLTDKEYMMAQQSLFDWFRSTTKGQVTINDVPFGMRKLNRFAEESVYSYNKMLRDNMVDMLDFVRDTVKPIDTISNPNPRGAGLGGV